MKPGEIISNNPSILLNEDSEVISLDIVNTGDRPVQIGSHFHFFEVNKFLKFDRRLAFGCRLNIPSGTAVRFEPGEKKEVELIKFSGACIAVGFNNLADSVTSPEKMETSILNLKNNAFSLD